MGGATVLLVFEVRAVGSGERGVGWRGKLMQSQSPDQGRLGFHTPLSLRGGHSEPVNGNLWASEGGGGEYGASYPGKLEVSTHQNGGGLIWG